MTAVGSLMQTEAGGDAGLPFSSIFFLPAECDLYQYITDTSNFPNTDTNRLRNLHQMLSICRGLEWLHQNLGYEDTTDKFELASYYHCDLGPGNILVCSQRTRAGEELVFKISDFGQAIGLRQKPKKHPKSRRHRPGPSLPPRLDPDRGTYLAPEVRTEPSSKSDVWSFGCILLMIIIFNYENASGIKGFQDHRMVHSSPERSGDKFYILQGGKPVVNQAVDKYINGLANRLKDPRDESSDAKVTNSILRYLQKHVLVAKVEKRHTMDTVSATLHEYYNDRPATYVNAITHQDIQNNAKFCRNFMDGRMFTYSTNMIQVYDHERPEYIAILRRPIVEKWSDSINSRSRLCSGTEVCVVSEPNKGGATVSESCRLLMLETIADI